MNTSTHNQIVSFIWSIADDYLRDVYVRGKYRDVILPMTVLRRLDALLESSKEKVLEEAEFQQKEMGKKDLGDVEELRLESGYVFYNTSKWTLKALKETASNNQQILETNFEEYLDGFSDNVKEIIQKFDLKSKIKHMASKQVLLGILEKFVSPEINLTPFDKTTPDGRTLPALSNLGMGYVFEELIRKFNEENNEEAGEHFTPREVIDLMTHLIFDPIKEDLPPAISIYDPACGSGGMLTESQNFIKDEAGKIKASNTDIYLFGKEINDETYAICKSDMMIKGNNPQHIRIGSTLATDEFMGETFHFMLSNPPYGKSWKNEESNIKEKKEIIDKRFEVSLKDYWGREESQAATPRSSDGQLLFLMEMVNKMKPLSQSPVGARIASVHNGSSLFTGDAGSGESNIRRYIIENDWLDCIVQLPNNLFYNTGITTYIWLLNNHKSEERKGKVILIDASEQYQKLRKNLGNKNCELSKNHIQIIQDAYINFENVERKNDTDLAAKVFDNADFGYYKVTIERPKRLKAQLSADNIAPLRFDKKLEEAMQMIWEQFGEKVYTDLPNLQEAIKAFLEENELELKRDEKTKLLKSKIWEDNLFLLETAQKLAETLGNEVFMDFNIFKKKVEKALKDLDITLSSSQKNTLFNAISTYDENAEKVIKSYKKFKPKDFEALLKRLDCTEAQLADFGYYPTQKANQYIIYETESDLRDYENVPLKDNIYDYFLKEVKPHLAEAWIDLEKTKIGYEISFNKYFYQHKPLRELQTVEAEILALEKESEGLILSIIKNEGIDN